MAQCMSHIHASYQRNVEACKTGGTQIVKLEQQVHCPTHSKHGMHLLLLSIQPTPGCQSVNMHNKPRHPFVSTTQMPL